jgi:chemotaxis protein methyltransferase CheR
MNGTVSFQELKELVLGATGLAYYRDRDTELRERVERRCRATGATDIDAYLARLRQERGELDALVAELTIGETYFFRYAEQMEALGSVVLPALLLRNAASRELRIWSAGCATGPEPYSVAILLRRLLGPDFGDWKVSILGTDINRRFLAQAEEGRYEDWALRGVVPEVVRASFVHRGRSWVLRPELRSGVSFRHHNLVEEPFRAPDGDGRGFDLILCRNVLIYFERDIFRRLASELFRALVPGGWLLVGSSELDMEAFRPFVMHTVTGATLYQRPPEEIGAWSSAEVGPESVVWASAAAAAAAGAPETVAASPRLSSPHWPLGEPDPFPIGAAGEPEASVATAQAAAEANTAEELARARRLADAGGSGEALELLAALAAREPLDPAIRYWHGLVLEQMGRAAEAEYALRQAIYLDRGFALGHFHLGLLRARRGDAAAATRSLRAALGLARQLAGNTVLADGELTAGRLVQLVEMHLEAWRR